jgi:hypothetical protein
MALRAKSALDPDLTMIGSGRTALCERVDEDVG